MQTTELVRGKGSRVPLRGNPAFRWSDPRVLALIFVAVFLSLYAAMLRRTLASTMAESGYEPSGSPLHYLSHAFYAGGQGRLPTS